jgi:hypothetical protein
MESLKKNAEHLRKILGEDNFKREEAEEFLDAILSDAENMNTEYSDLEREKNSIEIERDELFEKLEEGKELSDNIDCGMGNIEYEVDNLALGELMENLDRAIQKQGYLRVSNLLQAAK